MPAVWDRWDDIQEKIGPSNDSDPEKKAEITENNLLLHLTSLDYFGALLLAHLESPYTPSKRP